MNSLVTLIVEILVRILAVLFPGASRSCLWFVEDVGRFSILGSGTRRDPARNAGEGLVVPWAQLSSLNLRGL